MFKNIVPEKRKKRGAQNSDENTPKWYWKHHEEAPTNQIWQSEQEHNDTSV